MVGWMECLSFRDLWQIGTSLTWRALYTYMEWVRAEAIRQTKLAICEAVIDDDRGFDYRSNFSPFRVSVTGLWMLSNDFESSV